MSGFRPDAGVQARLGHGPAAARVRAGALDRLGEAVVLTRADGRPIYANRAARDLAATLALTPAAGVVDPFERAAVGVDGAALAPGRQPSEVTRLTGRPCERAQIVVPTADGGRRRLAVTTRRTSDDGPTYDVVASYSLIGDPLAARLALEEAAAPTGAAAEAPGLPRGDDQPGADAQRALRQARELFSTAFHHAPIGMALIDPSGRWLLVNQALCDLVGYSETELLERTLHDVTHPDDLPGQLALMRELLAGGRSSYQLDKRYLHADGHVIWASISVSLVRDDTGAPLHLITQIVDITERHHSEQRLQHLADHDPLTGVLNRRRFEEELIRQIDRCRRYDERATLVMVDLDFFKDVNDCHGHAAGDETLQAVAAALLGHVRSSDTLARVGGDEFAALLVGVGADQAAIAAAGLAAVVRELDGTPAPITASVGATILRPDDQANTALLRADAALYRVKSEGRDGASVAPAAPPASFA